MKKQTFKLETLTQTKVVNRILRVYHLDNPTFDWYKEARDYALYLSAMHGQPFEICAGVIAALSPRKYWEDNMKQADNLFKTGTAGHMPLFVSKAQAIMRGEDILTTLNGRKIKNFYLNIIGDKNVVTIDRHALSIALGRKVTDRDYQNMTKKQYEFFEACYQQAAMKLNTYPSQVQAITWVNFKNYEKVNRAMAA